MDDWDALSNVFGDIEPDGIVPLLCGERGCRASIPCDLHERVVLHFRINGHEYPRSYLSKLAWRQLTEIYPDRRRIMPILASMATLSANQS
jgi:hypothetical protein